MKTCKVELCERASRSSGYCAMHYNRIRRTGDAGSPFPKTIRSNDILDRIANKFLVGDHCWEWTARIDHNGYGILAHSESSTRAHRILYELMVGPLPEGRLLHHTCENRACVRPDHLVVVTPREHHALHVEMRTA